MSEREIQIADLSQQLTLAFEQYNASVRQQQLCTNQISKCEITIKECDTASHKMYKAVGRMFVMAPPAELKETLKTDLVKYQAELKRATDMQKTFEAKKAVLTQQLNDLTPKEQK